MYIIISVWDGWWRGMGRKIEIYIVLGPTYDTQTSATNLGTLHIPSNQWRHSVIYSEEGGSRCARKRVHWFSLPGLRDGVKKRKIKGFGKRGNGGRDTHIMYCKKCRLFWKYDYTNLRRKYKKLYERELWSVLLSFLAWMSFLFLLCFS